MCSNTVQGNDCALSAKSTSITTGSRVEDVTYLWYAGYCAVLACPGLCTSDNSTTSQQCHDALYNSSVIMGYGELLRYD